MKKNSKPTKINTIDITDSRTYSKLADAAEKRRLSLRKYVNEVLKMKVDKDDFMLKYMPNLKKIAFEEGIIYVKDSKISKTSQIHIKNNIVFCDLCNSKSCNHVLFAMACQKLDN